MTAGMARHPGSWPGPVVLQRAAGVQTGAVSESTELSFELNGTPVEVPDRFLGASLLEVLRDVGGITSAKDGCAPQGQCGCCTVLVDGRARVSCVTPVKRVAGRSVTTLEGLEEPVAARWAEALLDHGGTQCGFCTPGIVMRLEERRRRASGPKPVGAKEVRKALAAHLCRCTGWQGITEAAVEVIGRSGGASPSRGDRDDEAAARRAGLEGATPQRIEARSALGAAPFAVDTVPSGALVAVRGADGEWIVAESLTEARGRSAKVQGRRSTLSAVPPLEVPPGEWAASLATSWVEPAYLETDASWCEPGGEPSSVLANGGAFGGKLSSPLPGVARELADRHGRPVLAVWSREDTVRLGPKRPPVAIGVRPDGTGVMRVASTAGVDAAVARVAPGLVVEHVDVRGPRTDARFRAAGWAEALCALVAAGVRGPAGGPDGDAVHAEAPGGGWARVRLNPELPEPCIEVEVGAGDALDATVLASYVTGAAHMAASMVCSEGLAIGPSGEPENLTVRSFGILTATAMPEVVVSVDGSGGEPRAVSEAVFAATAAAVWAHHGFPGTWPLGTSVFAQG